ncbi:MAG: amidohydrolase family protein [Solobacterium sp.]|nr:amidohydrolase family protein [Solobacterium sp.]
MRDYPVIDLCLDMPMQAEEYIQTLTNMCLDPNFRGYKSAYAPGIAGQIGLNIEELDKVLETEGEEAWKKVVEDAARKNAMTPDKFVEYLDSINVTWGITCDSRHDNLKTAEIVHAYPDRFKGVIFVDPNKGMEAVRELEKCVKDYGLHALYLTAFRTHLPANDKKNYPLYAKACELGIPVHIYSSLNLSKAVPYDIGHPRYIDEVARDFPELRIMAGVSGWPWVLDFISLAYRHQNVYLNFETHEPRKMNMRGSGYEPYLFYAETSLKDRICFASNWTTQSISVDDLVKQVEDLPLQKDTIQRILYTNAAEFYNK